MTGPSDKAINGLQVCSMILTMTLRLKSYSKSTVVRRIANKYHKMFGFNVAKIIGNTLKVGLILLNFCR